MLTDPALDADPGLLRRGPDRARLPRGRRPAGPRALPRGRGRAGLCRALLLRRERRPLRARLRGLRRRGRRSRDADDHRRGGRGERPLERGAVGHAEAARGPSRPAGLRRSRRRPRAARRGLRAATIEDLDLLAARLRGHAPRGARSRPARSATPTGSAGARSRQIQEGRSWLWVEDETILFKAEASAWTPSAVQLQQVWVDPERAGAGLRGTRPISDLCRLLSSARPPCASSSAPRTRPRSGSTRRSACGAVGTYRSVLF